MEALSSLHRVTEFSEFIELLPKAVQAFHATYVKWNKKLTETELATLMLSNFREGNEFYCEVTEEGEVSYIFFILDTHLPIVSFWIAYIHPSKRDKTTEWINGFINKFKKQGSQTIEFITARNTRSYRRFTEKFGAKPHLITYRINLRENN